MLFKQFLVFLVLLNRLIEISSVRILHHNAESRGVILYKRLLILDYVWTSTGYWPYSNDASILTSLSEFSFSFWDRLFKNTFDDPFLPFWERKPGRRSFSWPCELLSTPQNLVSSKLTELIEEFEIAQWHE